jgi:asparagine synthase (glutamine-hydrolysing)
MRHLKSVNQLPNNYVMKVDKANMSVSVEARAAFLDRRIAEVALSTPARFLLADGTNKYLLRSSAKDSDFFPHPSREGRSSVPR